MTSNSTAEETTQISRIIGIGMIGNLVLTFLKLIVGYIIGSIGLIADGFHSLSDLGTDFAVLIGTSLAARPADKNHPFGHGKFETFTVVIVAVALIGVGGGIIWKAISTFKQDIVIINGVWIMIIAGTSLITKEWLYRITLKTAERCHSSALKANAWHHRTDALSSIVVLAGGGAAVMGWWYGDIIAGLLVGLMVIAVGGKLGFEALIELSEGSVGQEIAANIEEIVSGFKEVRGSHRLRIRRIGRELMMDIHIILDPDITIKEGHEIVEKIEKAVQHGIGWPISLTIHVDPDEKK
ncbi:MAG: cation diffusion facilitator family transporter [Candidatus Hatepunaea meridiana]|nr:cation diffusion facilitator family transporter [Candidatus Hatepunaea meridiana]